MFQFCENLVFLNIKNFVVGSETETSNAFKSINSEVKICVNQNFGDYSLNSNCEDNCFKQSSKLISELKTCTDDCSRDGTYQYEYNGKCFITCPEGQFHRQVINFYV